MEYGFGLGSAAGTIRFDWIGWDSMGLSWIELRTEFKWIELCVVCVVCVVVEKYEFNSIYNTYRYVYTYDVYMYIYRKPHTAKAAAVAASVG